MGNGKSWDALWEAIEVEAALDAMSEDGVDEAGPNWAAIQKRRNMQQRGYERGTGAASRGPMGPAPAGLQTPAERERDQANRERQAQAVVAPPSVKAFFQGGPPARPGSGPQSAAPNPLMQPSGPSAPRIGGMTRPRPQAVRDDEVEDMPEAFTMDMPVKPLQAPDALDDDMDMMDDPMGGGEDMREDDITIPRSLAQELVDFLAAHGVDEPEDDDMDGDVDMDDADLQAGDEGDEEGDEEMDDLPEPPKAKKGPGRPPGSKNKGKPAAEKKPAKKSDGDGDDEKDDDKDEAMTPVKAQAGSEKRPPSYLPGVHSPSSPMRPGQSGPPKLGMPPGSQTKGEAADEMDEKHMGFKALSKSLSHEKGVTDPDALAASIGQKKYGKKGFAALSKKR